MVFCISFFLEAQALCNATQIFFHQIEKQEEIVKYEKENFWVLMTL